MVHFEDLRYPDYLTFTKDRAPHREEICRPYKARASKIMDENGK